MTDTLLSSPTKTQAPSNAAAPNPQVEAAAKDVASAVGYGLSTTYMTAFFGLLVFIVIASLWSYKYVLPKRSQVAEFVHDLGVGFKKAFRLVREMRRKAMHMVGLILPIVYYLGLKLRLLTPSTFSFTVGCFAVIAWTMEVLRRISPAFREWFKVWFGAQMRTDELEAEHPKITGIGFYSFGSFVCVRFFPPLIAITSILFLMLGDPAAALIGIARGRTKIGKKSLEGFLAMFSMCFAMGLVMFWQCTYPEYIAMAGALVASTVELIAPLGIDDNLTIPISSAAALYLAVRRTQKDTPLKLP